MASPGKKGMPLYVGSINRTRILTFPKKPADANRMTQLSRPWYPCAEGKGYPEAGLTLTGAPLQILIL